MAPRRKKSSPPPALANDHGAAEDRHPKPKTNAAGPSRLEQISKRAYELSQARGGTGGRALDDWLQAEREIDAENASGTEAEDNRDE